MPAALYSTHPKISQDTSIQKLTLPAEALLELQAPRLPTPAHISHSNHFQGTKFPEKQPNSGRQECVLALGTIKYKLMQTAKCNCTSGRGAESNSLEIYGEVDEIVGGEGLPLAARRDPLVGLDAVVVQHVEEQLLAATPNASSVSRVAILGVQRP